MSAGRTAADAARDLESAQRLAKLERRIAYDAARHGIEIECEEVGRGADNRPWFDVGTGKWELRNYIRQWVELLDARRLLKRSDLEPYHVVQILDDPEAPDAVR